MRIVIMEVVKCGVPAVRACICWGYSWFPQEGVVHLNCCLPWVEASRGWLSSLHPKAVVKAVDKNDRRNGWEMRPAV